MNLAQVEEFHDAIIDGIRRNEIGPVERVEHSCFNARGDSGRPNVNRVVDMIMRAINEAKRARRRGVVQFSMMPIRPQRDGMQWYCEQLEAQTSVIMRVEFLLSIQGYRWTGNDMAAQSPMNSELCLPENWELVA